MVCIYFASVKLLNNVTVEDDYIVHFTSSTTVLCSIAHFHLFIVFSI